ncbi:hypothetical protein JI721_12360 [Alicyclobacillus cycloheptanicus]|uniref:Uncharacterized protein n=1 Tax=Alicyclobacillus cycloheptanicus TaxID=1457 RepID=A0ABT9XGG8_9BACL|nr:hypothetical protein [Alicyclobacillus cycloheptanicus]MDQ0188851.1 hypothetical protein [Alicyclobacillus cycloheptanicus]WDM00503.1 hypothetical protein JI721_12360 [Alicyclobacillus cycloheptanicus]
MYGEVTVEVSRLPEAAGWAVEHEMESTTLSEEIRQALREVQARRIVWGMAEPRFEDAAWYAFVAARERLNALLLEARERVQMQTEPA